MRNYWLDKRYPLVTAIRDWRQFQDEACQDVIMDIFHEMASNLASPLLGSRREMFIIDMEDAAWDHVSKFDLKRRDQAVTYFTNVMKSVVPDKAVEDIKITRIMGALRQQAIKKSSWKYKKP